jgi:hypothetical protein
VSIDFTPHAVYDIDTASEYLGVEKDGGGERFRANLLQLLAHIEQMPEAA